MMQYALDEISGLPIHITSVSKATKDRFKLKCLDCHEDIIIKEGEIKVKHFSHKSISKHGYSGPESEEHKAAKILLAFFINQGNKIIIKSCKCNPANIDIQKCAAEMEYPVSNGIADIALIEKDQVKCIFEIKYKHATI